MYDVSSLKVHTGVLIASRTTTGVVPLHGNFELRPIGVAMGNALSVSRV